MRVVFGGKALIVLGIVGLLCPHTNPGSFDCSSFALLDSEAGDWGGGLRCCICGGKIEVRGVGMGGVVAAGRGVE